MTDTLTDLERELLGALRAVNDELFPAPISMNEGTKHMIDYSADSNLEAAIADMESAGKADALTIRTCKKVLRQLSAAHDILTVAIARADTLAKRREQNDRECLG